MRLVALAVFWVFTLGFVPAWAQLFGDDPGSDPIDPLPAVEWLERATPTMLSDDLMGDQIDAQSGGLSFNATDVSLPGNSGLFVGISRKRSQGALNGVGSDDYGFGDWQLEAPQIHVMHPHDIDWGPNRCSNDFDTSFPTYVRTKVTGANGGQFQVLRKEFQNHEYSTGVFLDVPEYGAQQMLEMPSPAPTASLSGAEYTTTSNWQVKCLSGATGVGEGFEAYAPNGDKYRFDLVVVRGAPLLNSINNTETIPEPFNVTGRERTVIYATEVTDVHGNWVRYTYNSAAQLTRIHSSDGREITLAYPGPNDPVQSITAKPTGGVQRTWQYEYESKQVLNQVNIPITYEHILKRVVLPDGRDWNYDLADLNLEPHQGITCFRPQFTVTVDHPDGMRGEFKLAERKMRIGEYADVPRPVCYDMTPYPTDRPIPYVSWTESLSVIEKKLSGNGVPTATWTYSYEEDTGDANSPNNGDKTNWTKIVEPDGTETTHFHKWNQNDGFLCSECDGRLVKSDIRASAGGSLIQSTTFDPIAEGGFGSTFLENQPGVFRAQRPGTNVMSRDGDTFTTVNTYNTDKNASNYSYGQPLTVIQTSSVSPGSRTAVMTYWSNTTDWIVGRSETVTRNGKLFDDYTYNSDGLVTRLDRFGQRVADFTYNGDGTVATVKDGLLREAIFGSYVAGIPLSATRPDGETISQTVDGNGWVTSYTDAKGLTTLLTYDSMGRITQIDRPGYLATINIGYAGLGAGLTQTITNGSEQTVTTFDRMLRPRQVHRQATSGGGGSIYTVTDYDALGRVTFQSFPGTSPLAAGVDTSYDGLGRVTQTRETVFPNATVTTAYLPGNITSVTDAEGHTTTTTRSAWGSPDNGEVTLIAQPAGVTTTMTHDTWGNLLTATQGGFTQTWTYDAQLRLCRHYTPETNSSVYRYDVAGQMTAKSIGQPGQSGCGSLPGNGTTNYTYDLLGRVVTIDNPNVTTDVFMTYDDNGNLLTNNRAGANWTYTYDAADALASETLVIDGRTYASSYSYNANGALTQQIYPSGAVHTYSPDGFGRPTGVSVNGTVFADAGSYFPNGTLQSLDWANGHTLTQSLDGRQMLATRQTTDGTSTAIDFAYGRDANGRITAINDYAVTGQDRSFTYDGLGRLTAASGPWGAGSFTYDNRNNLLTQQLGARLIEIEYDAQNQVDRARDSDDGAAWRTYIHDGRGNVINDGIRTFSYNQDNQPTTISGITSGSFQYDGHNRRVKQILDGDTIYSVYSLSGQLIHRDNLATGRQREDARVGSEVVARLRDGAVLMYYLHTDHLGSPATGSRADGIPIGRESYTPYGEPWFGAPGADDEPGFTTHVVDTASGLSYMQARYYDPVIGRFLSSDPMTFTAMGGDPAYMNRYWYAGGDPVNAWDPNGMNIRRKQSQTGCHNNPSSCSNINGTLGVAVEGEAIVGEGNGGAAGVFININEDEGTTTIGFFGSTKDGTGGDVDVSVAASVVGGGVSDFEGKAHTAEAEVPLVTTGVVRASLTAEGGTTESGEPVAGLEISPAGGGPTGIALYETTTTLGPHITFGGASQPGAEMRRNSRPESNFASR